MTLLRFEPAARRLWLPIAALIVSVASLSSTATADAYDAILTRAAAAKEKALDRNDPAAWEDALGLFQQADRLRATPETKYEIASAAAQLRQDDLAVENYEAALSLGLSGRALEKAQAYLDDKAAGMGRLEVLGPAGAQVWVGTRARGVLPLAAPLVVFAGPNALRVEFAGRSVTRSLELETGERARVDLRRAFDETRDPQGPGTDPPRAPPASTPPRQAEKGAQSNTTAWALAGGGGALLLVGGGVVVASYLSLDSRRDRLSSLCEIPSGSDSCAQARPGERDAAQSEVDAIATWKSVRVAGFVGVGVGAALAVTGLFLLARPASPISTLQPDVDVLSGRLGVRGAF